MSSKNGEKSSEDEDDIMIKEEDIEKFVASINSVGSGGSGGAGSSDIKNSIPRSADIMITSDDAQKEKSAATSLPELVKTRLGSSSRIS